MENIKQFQVDASLKRIAQVKQTLSHYQYAYRTEQLDVL